MFFFSQEVPNRSLKILAAVCKITSLAHLKICFPPDLYWQQQIECQPKVASEYVEKYLGNKFNEIWYIELTYLKY